LTHHTIREELLEAVFSMQPDLRLYNENQQDKRELSLAAIRPVVIQLTHCSSRVVKRVKA
jgi:hypothetical protein